MNEAIAAWCSLWRAPKVGSKTFFQIVNAFGSPKAFFDASDADVRATLPQVKETLWQSWRACCDEGKQDVDWLLAGEERYILTFDDPDYPPLLKAIDDPPPVLFVQGNVKALWLPQVAIVGSRQASSGALQNTYDFARILSSCGLVITSGLALGVDGAAHESALAAGGLTIAVVGTGLDRVYPAKHHALAHQIVKQGAMVSEFPIGVGVRSEHFPRRNRIISGLAAGVLVVEASLQSGSLITARLASEQGREVFAIPGSIHNPLAKGCHHLIKQGAKLVESAQDIVEELRGVVNHQYPIRAQMKETLAKAEPASSATPMASPQFAPSVKAQSALSEEERIILEAMGFEICTIDDLVERTGQKAEQVASQLLMLELDGRVMSVAGGRFQRYGA
ncbi:MAG: DNA-processing protein DprA [Cardiobacteriaceae bacterium]|nr:DNA-processing protein DprA [Cardiobacteriaceae bacterium]